ncbi:DUF4169 family protein [uncultured Tateyamaria sp.]|uniref:DUF4169 family protein n=1 Tax=uncultured Tateyamaria sp. TaxID=455651 RepID=UPI00262032C4|nr:DUF4169 family protein [uncultured Tateyamaria sp.]
MSDQPINLNKARKARARTAAKAQANAVRFGLTKDQKNARQRRKLPRGAHF